MSAQACDHGSGMKRHQTVTHASLTLGWSGCAWQKQQACVAQVPHHCTTLSLRHYQHRMEERLVKAGATPRSTVDTSDHYHKIIRG